MADPAMAAARDEAERLGMIVGSDVDRVEHAVLADCRAEESTIQRLIAQAEGQAKTIEALAYEVWAGTQRCSCIDEARGFCEQCRQALSALKAVGFAERMREWAG